MSHARSEPKDFKALAPDAYDIIAALGQAAAKAGIDKQLLELIKLRASQINGCAFCVQYHILQGESLGMPADKLNLAVVWRETPLFSARERAALAWTEALTQLDEGVSDEVYAQASAEFPEKELAYLTSAIASINVWNRLGVGYRWTPAGAAEAGARGRVIKHQLALLPSWVSECIASSGTGNACAMAGAEVVSGPISRPRPRIKRS